MQKLSSLHEPPKIGDTYLVPCIRAFNGETHKTHDLPIIGPAHSDPELNNPSWHCHLDVRFCTDDEILHFSSVKNLEGFLNVGWTTHDIPAMLINQKEINIEDVPKECLRNHVDLRSYKSSDGWTIDFYVPDEKMHSGMEDQCENKKLNLDCKVCPHKRIPLNSVPVYDGIITCPGHGLQFSAKTGKLIRRTGPKGKHAYKIGTTPGIKGSYSK